MMMSRIRWDYTGRGVCVGRRVQFWPAVADFGNFAICEHFCFPGPEADQVGLCFGEPALLSELPVYYTI